ncbi:unnamed protein product [Penicillium roqueforti FM164]|uniref:Uncharacterized protein n=1 Tax=Penicillium roqueforti (strain FM164) TaxID=1365484 RepID=W6QHU7_PENRF|nr:unnamed protein product [Penicillium roqueforti FM164]
MDIAGLLNNSSDSCRHPGADLLHRNGETPFHNPGNLVAGPRYLFSKGSSSPLSCRGLKASFLRATLEGVRSARIIENNA